ncbi:Sel1 repeat-containing protein [Virgibacillus subterraneus]|uniref:Sel1 repeat-containing protein n=1 Tax=Virgibacillus subterraneus TaxID=621109 RepID=A0A1H9GA19_9BACI|nr:restriction endonuclease [Virgibacillus subterraneus]SEQ47005.1 Sel1 repeat-containing protein [Virgibacillus subterraneus]
MVHKHITIDVIDLMTGIEFEEFISDLFTKMGFTCEITQYSKDQGIDVIALKNGSGFAIQTKRYKESSKVPNSAIQEVVAGLNYYNIEKGIVVTNSYFTESAKDLSKSNNIILWDRSELQLRINQYYSEIDNALLSETESLERKYLLGKIAFQNFKNKDAARWLYEPAQYQYKDARHIFSESLYLIARNEYHKKKAIRWYTLASKYGNLDAQKQITLLSYKLGMEYKNNNNNEKSVNWFLYSARNGDVKSQYQLGMNFFNTKSFSKSIKWFSLASNNGCKDATSMLNLLLTLIEAEQGNKEAQNSVGEIYSSGDIIDKDLELAHYWFESSSKEGHRDAKRKLPTLQFEIGQYYYNGTVPYNKDNNNALKWFTLASENGHKNASVWRKYLLLLTKATKGNAEAQFEIWDMITQDDNQLLSPDEEAFNWLVLSAENGYERAQFVLAKHYEYIHRTSDAIKWYKILAEKSDELAQLKLGDYYFYNSNNNRVYLLEALKWFKKLLKNTDNLIAKERIPSIQYRIAEQLLEDSPSIITMEEALEWYNHAVKNGSSIAKEKLDITKYKLAQQYLETSEEQLYGLQLLRELADTGNQQAQKEIGDIYFEGKLGISNLKEALKWYTLAAENDYFIAREKMNKTKYKLAQQYLDTGEVQLYGLQLLRELADTGNQQAQKEIGDIYFEGKLGTSNLKEALKWYTLAAENDYFIAKEKMDITKYKLAHQHLETDEEQLNGLQLLQELADTGNQQAQIEIGDIYFEGKLVRSNLKEALKWYTLAAENNCSIAIERKKYLFLLLEATNNNPEAQYQVWEKYRKEPSQILLDKKPLEWLLLSAENGYEQAQLTAGEYLLDNQNVLDGLKWLRVVGKKGNWVAQTRLANYYENSNDRREFIKWYTRLAETGDELAQFKLVEYYEENEETNEALRWYTVLAERGNISAQYKLGEYHFNNNPLSIESLIESLKWLEILTKNGGSAKNLIPKVFNSLAENIIKNNPNPLEEIIRLYKNKVGRTNLNEMQSSNNYNLAQQYLDTKDEQSIGLELLQELAGNGDQNAQLEVGHIYYDGRIIKRNVRKALKWYVLAGIQGVREAQYLVAKINYYGQIRESDNNKEVAYEWYKLVSSTGHLKSKLMCQIILAEKGDRNVQFQLGKSYEEGLLGETNFEEAIAWYKEAADRGHNKAQWKVNNHFYKIGMDYYRDNFSNVEENKKKAFYFFKNAAKFGNKEAQYFVGKMLREGDGVEINKSESLKWLEMAASNGSKKAKLMIRLDF